MNHPLKQNSKWLRFFIPFREKVPIQVNPPSLSDWQFVTKTAGIVIPTGVGERK
jgi:hypothetical protein